MVVYLLRNLVNGKGYVGQTIRGLEKRWKQHLYDAKSGKRTALYNAIRLYGPDSFERCVLAEAHTLDELNALEVFHIKAQGTLAPNGYNLTNGGQLRLLPQSIAKMAESQKGKKYHLGHKHSDESKKMISMASKGRIPPNKGKKMGPMSEETRNIRNRVSQARVGVKMGPLSDAHKAALSLAAKNRKSNPPRSEQAKRNMSAAQCKRFENGEGHYSAKLTSGQVAQIRNEMEGEKGHKRADKVRELAARYGVSRSTIRTVASGRTWKHCLPKERNEDPKQG